MPTERLLRNAAYATLASAAIGVLSWWFPRPWAEQRLQRTKDSQGLQQDVVISPQPEDKGSGLASAPTSESPKLEQRLEPARAPNPEANSKTRHEPRFPVTFTLAEGHQKVVANGELSVSGEFNQIGEMIVPTLHVQARGREPEDHALLSAGGRFEVAVGERTYVVAVIAADTSARRFEIEVDLLR